MSLLLPRFLTTICFFFQPASATCEVYSTAWKKAKKDGLEGDAIRHYANKQRAQLPGGDLVCLSSSMQEISHSFSYLICSSGSVQPIFEFTVRWIMTTADHDHPALGKFLTER